jgi:uncharacterized protein (DUF433 family)
MVDVAELLDEAYTKNGSAALADLPIDALQGVSLADAEAIRKAFGIETIRQLAEHKVIRAAQAITALSGPGQMESVGEGSAAESTDVVTDRAGLSGGYPVIGNTRIPVRLVVEAFRETNSVRGAIKAFPQLSAEEVRAAVTY